MGPAADDDRAYRLAQRAIADLKAAVRLVLATAGEPGLRNAEIGRALGIYYGYGEAGHVGHIPRAVLGRMEQDGSVEQDAGTKRWRLRRGGDGGPEED